MGQNSRFAIAIVLALLCASTSRATTTAGNNLDGNMSLIYVPTNGGVYIENAPLPNPAVSKVKIQSAAGLLNPGALTLPPVFGPPPISVNGVPNGSGTNTLIEVTRGATNFLGTGSYLGAILPPGMLQTSLEADLTIDWGFLASPYQPGDLIIAPTGSTQFNPILPTQPGNNGFFRFFNVATGQFCDPPMASGYQYDMLSASLFTKVEMPIGLGSNFTIVSSEGVVSGIAEGGSHTFSGGVPSFKILGISPAVDADDPGAFPVYLEFSTSVADFTMTAIPEPATLALFGVALFGALGVRSRRR